MKPLLPSLVLLLAASLLGSSLAAEAPQPRKDEGGAATSGELFDTVARLDRDTFAAFNAHDVDLLMARFTNDLEFYHDTGGLTDYRQTRENFRGLFERTPDIRRDLVPGSLKVYPIKDHGAIELGEHRFCHRENGREDCGTFKFAMIWRREGEVWKLSRVISYAH